MSDAADGEDALREQLSRIDELPLDQRADAFAQVHAQLQSLLEGNDARANLDGSDA